jgi:hypothetical protein
MLSVAVPPPFQTDQNGTTGTFRCLYLSVFSPGSPFRSILINPAVSGCLSHPYIFGYLAIRPALVIIEFFWLSFFSPLC